MWQLCNTDKNIINVPFSLRYWRDILLYLVKHRCQKRFGFIYPRHGYKFNKTLKSCSRKMRVFDLSVEQTPCFSWTSEQYMKRWCMQLKPAQLTRGFTLCFVSSSTDVSGNFCYLEPDSKGEVMVSPSATFYSITSPSLRGYAKPLETMGISGFYDHADCRCVTIELMFERWRRLEKQEKNL